MCTHGKKWLPRWGPRVFETYSPGALDKCENVRSDRQTKHCPDPANLYVLGEPVDQTSRGHFLWANSGAKSEVSPSRQLVAEQRRVLVDVGSDEQQRGPAHKDAGQHGQGEEQTDNHLQNLTKPASDGIHSL